MTRTFGLRDLLTIKHLEQRGTVFDLRRSLLRTAAPTRAAMLGYVSHHNLGAVTCVERETAHRGFVQAWPRNGSQVWDIGYLSPSLIEHRQAPGIWHRLLCGLVSLGMDHDILRIYARCAEDPEAEGIMRQAGFTLVTREEVFCLTSTAQPAPIPRGLRPVDSADRWSLGELYRQVVPPIVQKAESIAPSEYADALQNLVRAPRSEHVWAEHGRLYAYMSVAKGPHCSWMECVVNPEHRADLLPVLRYLLALAAPSAENPLYFVVPDYAVGLGWLLRTLGFSSYARQTVMVAHTVARVHVRNRMPLPNLEGADYGAPVGRIVTKATEQRTDSPA